MRRTLWLVAIGLTVGLSIPLIYGGSGLFQRVATFPLSLLATALTMILLGWNFSAARLRIMLHGIRQPMVYWRALATIIATEFACCATPAGGGGPLAYVFLLKRHGASGTGAAALYALDILMDLLFFATALLAITLAVLIQPEQLRVGWQLSLLAALLASAAVLAWGVVKHYRSVLLWGGAALAQVASIRSYPPAHRAHGIALPAGLAGRPGAFAKASGRTLCALHRPMDNAL